MIVMQVSGVKLVTEKLDALVVFGRGIEKSGETWVPTAYLECRGPSEQGGRFRAAGLTLTSETAVVAGAHANVLAAVHLLTDILAKGELPVLVFAAGRPVYLEKEHDELAEGDVLFNTLKASIGLAGILSRLDVQIQRNNKNTFDDVRETLRMAVVRGFSHIAVISVLVHLPRIVEFHRHLVLHDLSFAKVSVDFRASEFVLLGKGPVASLLCLEDPSIQGPLNDAAVAKILNSPAYRRTADMEANGIQDFRDGRYRFSL